LADDELLRAADSELQGHQYPCTESIAYHILDRQGVSFVDDQGLSTTSASRRQSIF
jgi:hypothetical protein